MQVSFDPTDITLWGSISAAAAAIGVSVKYWYHVRRLSNADKIDGSITKSLGFVLTELRSEIGELKAELKGRRIEIEALKADNRALSTRVSECEGRWERALGDKPIGSTSHL